MHKTCAYFLVSEPLKYQGSARELATVLFIPEDRYTNWNIHIKYHGNQQ
jgi:hypothetical protein